VSRPLETPGIHHLSVVVGDPHHNRTFYRDTLGLRLTKRTVNHDEPHVSHLYYGDRVGTPGTTFTAFPYPLDPGGRVGAGQPGETAFAVPSGSLGFWSDRLVEHGVDADEGSRFGERVLRFEDPDGLPLALVESATAGRLGSDGLEVVPWTETVPEQHALRGLYSTTLHSRNRIATAQLLELLGFGLVGQDGERVRYVAGSDGVERTGLEADTATLATEPTPGTVVDLWDREEPWGKEGAGTGHHLALRVANREALDEWYDRLVDTGLSPSRPRERYYFDSVYVRDPGGVLFELATDGPGLTRDEAVENLGSDLRLPPWLEADEETIRQQLPSLDRPVEETTATTAGRE
jgi:glyoxalase family protein